MRLLPIFFVASFAASGVSNEDSKPANVERRFWGPFGDEMAVERRADEKRFFSSLRSMLRRNFKDMHKKVSNANINVKKDQRPDEKNTSFMKSFMKLPFREE